jgi:hypothetical protein
MSGMAANPPNADGSGMDPAMLATLMSGGANAPPTQPQAAGQMPPIANPLLSNPGLMQMLMGGDGAGAGGALPVPAQPAGPPEEVYATQLQQLRDMGFYDPIENVRALQRTNGNVDYSIEWLLNNPPGQ